jgi:general secretion pathway protein D
MMASPSCLEAGSSGGVGGSASGNAVRSVAENEVVRRKALVDEAYEAVARGDALAAEGDYEGAIAEYRVALDTLPKAPMTGESREIILARYTDTSVELAQQRADNGRYGDARALLEGVLEVDPENAPANKLLAEINDPEIYNPAMSAAHVADVQRVTELLRLAEDFYELGQYEEAEAQVTQALRIDRTNSAARRMMVRINGEKNRYYQDARVHTRSRMLAAVDATWESQVPVRDIRNIAGREVEGERSRGKKAVGAKLNTIVIPKIQFIDATVSEAIEFLKIRSRDLDTLETRIEDKGVNILLKASVDGPETPRISLDVVNMPLGEALRYVTDMAGLKFKIEQFAVLIVPITDVTSDLYTRVFRVPPDFLSVGGGDAGGGADVALDPFAPASADGGAASAISKRKSAREILEDRGVSFPEGASAFFNPSSSQLIVRNTQSSIELIEAYVQDIRNQVQRQLQISTRFVEVRQTNLDELGFDWLIGPFNIAGDQVFGSGGVAGNGSVTAPGDFTFNNPVTGSPIGSNPVTKGLRFGRDAIDLDDIDAVLEAATAAGTGTTLSPGIFGISGVFTDPQFQMMIRGLAQKEGVDLMSAPTVVTRSGQRAKIEVIREFIYPVEFDPPEIPENTSGSVSAGGSFQDGDETFQVGTSQATPVTPTTPTAFEMRPVGVTMEVDPVIGSDGFTIDLNILPEVVEFEGFINYGSPIKQGVVDGNGNPGTIELTANNIQQPIFATRRVSTSVTVWDGQTVAIGGLIREDVQSVEDKVPFLGDLPMIGRLFQTKADQYFKRNLMIFVSTRMIDPSGSPIRTHDQLHGNKPQ